MSTIEKNLLTAAVGELVGLEVGSGVAAVGELVGALEGYKKKSETLVSLAITFQK